jgi:hypothetical protein
LKRLTDPEEHLFLREKWALLESACRGIDVGDDACGAGVWMK